jgi:hypothetical protein
MNGSQARRNSVAGAFAGSGDFRGSRDGFGPQQDNHNQNSVQYTGYQNVYGQQYVRTDFGGALWGQNGGLGDGLGGVMYHHGGSYSSGHQF